MRSTYPIAWAAAALALSSGCMSSPAMTNAGGGFGATQGGVQDLGLARELIKNGQVPPAEAFIAEGIFSEHDLPLDGPPCSRLLCLRAASGVAPDLAGKASGWVQVGLSSSIDPEHFQRPSLAVVAVVDVSGSMSWDYSGTDNTYPTGARLARHALEKIVEQLGPQDRIAIVTFESSSRVEMGFVSGDQHPQVMEVIDGLRGGGATNMEAGLRDAYALARAAQQDGGTEQVRVMVFTDAQPNTGASTPDSFEGQVGAAASEGIGMTIFGIGLGLSEQTFSAMSHLRGCNAFSLFKLEQTDELLAENWPWMVSPIAYDLAVDFAPNAGFSIGEAYGFPQGTTPSASLSVSTVFLSRNRGALLVRLAPEGADVDGLVVSGTLRYLSLQGERVEQSVQSGYAGQALDDRGQYFEQPGVRETVALAVLVGGMRRAAETYASDHAAAVQIMDAVVARAEADAPGIVDATFADEVKLAKDLRALMSSGAPQGDLYGQR